jgi:hypothetical protein
MSDGRSARAEALKIVGRLHDDIDMRLSELRSMVIRQDAPCAVRHMQELAQHASAEADRAAKMLASDGGD